MIDKNSTSINDLEIGDFEELATHIIQAQDYNTDFVRCGVDIWYEDYSSSSKNRIKNFIISIPYCNSVDDYFFTRGFGLLLPHLKVDNLNYLSLITPFIDGDLIEKESKESKKLIRNLINQVEHLNSTKDNFIVTSTKILNYTNLKSSEKPNTYTFHFDYVY